MDRHSVLRRLAIDFLVITLLAMYVFWGNTSICVTRHTVASTGLPEEFARFTIAQISDLHNTEFGENNGRLLAHIEAEAPDIIVLTGDLIDAFRTDMDIAVGFATRAAAIAPTYYVQGNHERHTPGTYEQLRDSLRNVCVTVLEDEALPLRRGSAEITLAGLLDRSSLSDGDSLVRLSAQFSGFTILLSHRPEHFGRYAGAGADLVFSGHAHGGQFRLPFIGGLYAPGQGVFPVYDAGLHTLGSTQMIVSRGLGNSRFPFRLNNRPELVVVELIPSE